MKVLFVCTGNICRSPLAEGILREKFSVCGIKGFVDSAGFESFHLGDMPDERARKVAREHGINISGHQARLFSVKDFDLFDRIYVMDNWHFQNVMRLARNDADRAKVDFTMNAAEPGKNKPVPDPYYDGYGAFERVYIMLDSACGKIAESVLRKNE
jgi:protein-tyrosine phosphatase